MEKTLINKDKIRSYFIKRLRSANLQNFDLIFKKEIKKFGSHLKYSPALIAQFYDSKELFGILSKPLEKDELIKLIINIAWGSKGQITSEVTQNQKNSPSYFTNFVSWLKFGR